MNIFLSPVLSPFTSSISRLKIQLKHLKLNLLIPHSTCKLNSNKIDTTLRQETSSNRFHYVNAHAIYFFSYIPYLHLDWLLFIMNSVLRWTKNELHPNYFFCRLLLLGRGGGEQLIVVSA
jgi:hypothetical protein